MDIDNTTRLQLLIAQLEDAAAHFDKHGVEKGLERWRDPSISALLRRLAKQARQ